MSSTHPISNHLKFSMPISIFKPRVFFIATSLLVSINTSHAAVGWLDSIEFEPKNPQAGEAVSIEIRLAKEADPKFSYYCGVEVRMGDGHVDKYVIGRHGAEEARQPVAQLSHTFARPGNYSVLVEGALVFRGLKTAPPCRGDSLNSALLVAGAEREPAGTPAVAPKLNTLEASAEAPANMKAPLDQSDLLKHSLNDAVFSDLVSMIQQKNKGAIPLLLLKAKAGDAFAQTFLGVYYEDGWSEAPDAKAACYWYRRAAEGGVSSARLMVANRALKTPDCFSPRATVMQAYTWVQLAMMSKDRDIKASASALLAEIKASQK
jgi:hypothetical protein